MSLIVSGIDLKIYQLSSSIVYDYSIIAEIGIYINLFVEKEVSVVQSD